MATGILPRLKLITKRDFDIVRGKYVFQNSQAENIVNGANEWDVLALTVVPGSGLKILNAKILDEDSFMQLLQEGVKQ